MEQQAAGGAPRPRSELKPGRKGALAGALFLGSALLFCIEPMLGRTLLPHFGGSASVWTMCLASYQALLLAGALYADRLGRAPARTQYRAHLAALALAAVWAGVFAARRVALCGAIPEARGALAESAAAMGCVAAFIGIPFVVVGAGSSLLQRWAEEAYGAGRETYRLYAVSNAGSLAGLLAYPLAVEPFVPLGWQWGGLAAALALYAALCAAAGARGAAGRRPAAEAGASAAPDPLWPNTVRPSSLGGRGNADLRNSDEDAAGSGDAAPPAAGAAAWLALPALSTALLNATTTHITSDVEPMPLMWAVLLAAFLLSYIVGFSRAGERLLPLWLALAGLSAVFAAWAMGAKGSQEAKFAINLAAGLCMIFFGGCFAHAWLCQTRPYGALITRYYLFIAAGGAAGGLAAALLPPLLFDTVAEYPLAVAALAGAVLWRGGRLAAPIKPAVGTAGAQEAGASAAPGPLWPNTVRPSSLGALVAWVALALWLRMAWLGANRGLEDAGRSFYGSWRVGRDAVEVKRTGETIPMRIFMHGGTMHGYETIDPVLRGPTTYYGPWAGGLAFSLNPGYAAGRPVRCGMVGMGVGVMAYYGRKGDEITFYELDAGVAEAARRHFSFVPKSKAEVRVEIGDARKALEKERDADAPRHDILVVDAYSGDSIPYHLITRQAFRLYADRLAEGGTLALHVSNWHIDLLPVCKAAARELGMRALGVFTPGGRFTMDATWVFLSRDGAELPANIPVETIDWAGIADRELPDDEKGSILPYVRFARIGGGEEAGASAAPDPLWPNTVRPSSLETVGAR